MADSTNPSAVGFPSRSKISFSKDPEFTPILIGIFLSFAASATIFTLSILPIFPGFNLKADTPFSIAFNANL